MSNYAIIFGIYLTALTALRGWLGKECADKYDYITVVNSLAISLLLVSLGYLIYDASLLKEVIFAEKTEYAALTISFFKGFLLFNTIKCYQILKRQSLSSAVFFGPVAMAIGAIINSYMGENLSQEQFYGLIGLGVISFIFFFFGHTKELDKKGYIALFSMTALGVAMISSDQYSIPRTNWFNHIFLTSISYFICFLTTKNLKSNLKIMASSSLLIISAIFWVLREYSLIYAMIKIMPVSMVVFFLHLSIPIVMLLSAIKYKESGWKEQLIYGILMTILAVVVVLG